MQPRGSLRDRTTYAVCPECVTHATAPHQEALEDLGAADVVRAPALEELQHEGRVQAPRRVHAVQPTPGPRPPGSTTEPGFRTRSRCRAAGGNQRPRFVRILPEVTWEWFFKSFF